MVFFAFLSKSGLEYSKIHNTEGLFKCPVHAQNHCTGKSDFQRDFSRAAALGGLHRASWTVFRTQTSNPSDFRERSYHIGSIFKTHFNKAVVGLCLTQICTLSRWKQETRIQPSKSYLRTWFVYAFIPLMSWGKNSFVKKQMFRSIRITVEIVNNHWEWRNPNWLYRFSVPASSPLLHMRTSLLNIFR